MVVAIRHFFVMLWAWCASAHLSVMLVDCDHTAQQKVEYDRIDRSMSWLPTLWRQPIS